MKLLLLSETSGTTHSTTKHQILENLKPHQHRCGNLKPRSVPATYLNEPANLVAGFETDCECWPTHMFVSTYCYWTCRGRPVTCSSARIVTGRAVVAQSHVRHHVLLLDVPWSPSHMFVSTYCYWTCLGRPVTCSSARIVTGRAVVVGLCCFRKNNAICEHCHALSVLLAPF
jgi:hypothetical protein